MDVAGSREKRQKRIDALLEQKQDEHAPYHVALRH